MSDDNEEIVRIEQAVSTIKAEIEKASPSRRKRIYEAITVAALSSIPWIGGVLATAANYKIREGDTVRDGLVEKWLEEHERKLQLLRDTLEQMVLRLEGLGDEIEERICSEDYLTLVRKTFRQWDEADTDEKRRLLVQLITNAAGTRVAADDIVRLFLDWLDIYHEVHFAVIREIHKNEGPTRYDIWVAIYGEPVPRDDSAQADLFRMIIRDLSTGDVIRQPRDSDGLGRFVKRRRPSRRTATAGTMTSAFDDEKTYVLTDLGSQFVHYTMNELVKRIGS
jgi:hypothetical protein